MNDLGDQRRKLAEELRSEGIADDRVLQAIVRVRRDLFVPPAQVEHAYRNSALPIGEGQTISQPFVVALMTQELALIGTERVLEIGTGSGYQTAILAELAEHVVSVERHDVLLERARRILTTLGYGNVELHVTNGSLGWRDGAPYDRVIVTAAAPEVPRPLLDQLGQNGRLVVPVGSAAQQDLIVITRDGDRLQQKKLGPVRFVPLVGEAGWGWTDDDDAAQAGS
jgi:protein-L-isoaspartate(D-aspartate) O-methyltransferase